MFYLRGPIALLLSFIVSAGAFAEAPPTEVLTVDVSGAGAANVKESGRVLERQSETFTGFSYIKRRPLCADGLYWSSGLYGERWGFDNARDFPVRELQDYGFNLSLEYFVGTVRAAYITLRPGFYFETHPTLAAWDVPVEIATGIPMRETVNGLVGVAYGRFYHHPIPIAGFSWTINDSWRVDALYPDPAIVYRINARIETSLAGELIGNAYRTDATPGRSVIEYHVYRVGGTMSWRLNPGIKLMSGAGVEYERVFDFWRADRSLRATGIPYLRIGVELSR